MGTNSFTDVAPCDLVLPFAPSARNNVNAASLSFQFSLGLAAYVPNSVLMYPPHKVVTSCLNNTHKPCTKSHAALLLEVKQETHN